MPIEFGQSAIRDSNRLDIRLTPPTHQQMARTYTDLQDQIARLQTEADQLRRQELSTVVAKMRADIEVYGITPQDLFGKLTSKKSPNERGATASAKFSDGNGNSWVGRGARPRWLRDALAAGKRLEDFVAGAKTARSESSESSAPPKAVKRMSKKVTARKAAPKKSQATVAST